MIKKDGVKARPVPANRKCRRVIPVFGIAASMLLFSCTGDFPYRPEQFVPPKPSVPTIPLVNRSDIQAFLHAASFNFKLAFTSKADQFIHIVDFGSLVFDPGTGDSVVTAFTLRKDPSMAGESPDSPLFSPDGKWVAYFVFHDVKSQSAHIQKTEKDAPPVLIAEQGTDPHFWRDPTGGLYVIYSDKFQTGHDELPKSTGYHTFRQRVDPETGAKLGAPVVLAGKPFNGGLSAKGRYLCTGYFDGGIYDCTDSTLYRVNFNQTEGAAQICNPSISPDTAHEDWMLFLPFAGKPKLSYASGITPLGTIGMHEYLIVADKSNTARWYCKAPAGHTEWQDPEWTNRDDFIVALAKINDDDNDPRHDCYLVRRSDNASLNLTVESYKLDNTATPNFWIGP